MSLETDFDDAFKKWKKIGFDGKQAEKMLMISVENTNPELIDDLKRYFAGKIMQKELNFGENKA
jgi:hypothetical protein